jgi:glucosylceramidase
MSTPINCVLVALCVAGCASQPASTSGQAGGSTVGGGLSGAGPIAGSNGNSLGGSAGSSPAGGSSGDTGGSSSPGAGQSGDGGGAPNGGATMASGGSAMGNAGSAGSAGSAGAPSLPEFVTSAANAYWNTAGQVTLLTSGTADLSVDENTKYQRWDGFGGCFNEMGWDALSVLTGEIPRAMKLLFDAKDGANLAYGRLPLGASDYSMSWYTLDDTAGDFTMEKFSIARDREKLIPFIKAALATKPDLHLWASPWVVPGWMMDSSRNMKSDAQTLGAHALYMARFVEEYAKDGLKIEAIHPQNEPGYARVHWTQALLIDFMKTYLGPTFAQRNLSTEIWCGTMSKNPEDTDIAKAAALDAAAMKYIKGFGVQWNLQDAVPTLAAKGPVMQTEHRCGNYNFESPYWDRSRYDANKAQNDHLYGEESWQLIRDWIVSGVNSYSAWNMVLDSVGKSLDNWPQNALLVVDRSAKTLTVTAAYYAFRHYSRYIMPGATRIGLEGSKDALAFKNLDGSIITELYNSGTSPKKTTVNIGGALYQFEVPAHGWATLRVAQ